MKTRKFGRSNWQVGEVGYGMWGLAGWSGSDDDQTRNSLQKAVDLGCNFFDTAWAYGEGHSEKILGELIKNNLKKSPLQKLYTASKIPPKSRIWPAKRGFLLKDNYPATYIREYTEKTLTNLGLASVDLMQFHTWEDDWANDESWQKAVSQLKADGLIKAVGVSINRWEPTNVVNTLRTGLIDSVQVVYNIFDQNPEDELFPLCRELNIAVIARVPFDEGSLTGALTADSKWDEGDWRNGYFSPPNLKKCLERIDKLKQDIPAGATIAQIALRYILSNPDVSVVIPGMRKIKNVVDNINSSFAGALDKELMAKLHKHRWLRTASEWQSP